MRDHTKLRAFELADELVLHVYQATKMFPREEQFGLVSQMRRAAVSIVSNIVEGCARFSEAEYVHFLEMAFGSARELEYQISLSHRLGFLPMETFQSLHSSSQETAKVIGGLIRSFRKT